MRRDLNSLYPAPKSFEQKTAERKRADTELEARKPKHIAIWASLRLLSIWIVLAVVVQLLIGILQNNLISGVFTCFLFGLVWVGYALWMMRYISDSFMAYSRSANTFLVLYFVALPPLAVTVFSQIHSLPLQVGAILCVHFVLCFVLIKWLYKL